MSASMRSTLQTVPESVPADHVTNSKVSWTTEKTLSPLCSCNRKLSYRRRNGSPTFMIPIRRTIGFCPRRTIVQSTTRVSRATTRFAWSNFCVSFGAARDLPCFSRGENKVARVPHGFATGTTRTPFRRSILCLVTQNVLRVRLNDCARKKGLRLR